MNWEDERYVRLYTRDTGDWCALSWDGQALLMQLLRKADRSGVIQLGKRGRAALPLLLFQAQHTKRIDEALTELTEGGCVELHESHLVIPDFVESQVGHIRPTIESGRAVYFVQRGENGPVKIGHSKNPANRMRELQVGCPDRLHLMGTTPGGRHLERQIHIELEASRLQGEWFESSAALAVARRICK